jgi:hypothetical protein
LARWSKDGKPVPGVVIGMAHTNRDVAKFLGDQKIRTDDLGQFLFRNVPAGEPYVIYGLMESCRAHGAIGTRPVNTGPEGSSKDVGTLIVEPGFRLTGRVVLSDGKPLPAGIRASLSRRQAWDVQIADVTADGRFTFTGLPAEGYTLSAAVPGYHLSAKNASYEALNGSFLEGRVDQNVEGLRLLLEPGKFARPDFGRFTPEDFQAMQRRRNELLQGAPASADSDKPR